MGTPQEKRGEPHSSAEACCQLLFGSPSYQHLLSSGLQVKKETSDTLKSVYRQVSEALSVVGDPILLGSLGAGILLPNDTSIEVLVHVVGYSTDQLHSHAATTSSALSSAGFEDMQSEGRWKLDGISVAVVFGDEQRFEPSAFMHAAADDPDRLLQSASVLPYRTRFLQSQPPATKQFLRIVRYWAEMRRKDWEERPNSTPSTYLLQLLALDAFQSVSGDLEMEERLDVAMRRFLQTNCQLSSDTLIFSEVFYKKDAVTRALSCVNVQACLRPAGFEQHPLVLDPASITSNVALETADLSKLAEVSRQDLGILMSANPVTMQEMQKKVNLMQVKLDQVQRVLSSVLSSSFYVAATFEFEALGCKWLEKEPSVLLDNLQVGALSLCLVTRPSAIVDNGFGYYTAELDFNLRLPKQLGESALDVLQVLPSSLKLKMKNLVVSSSFKSRTGSPQRKKAEGKFMDTHLGTSPGSTSSGYGFTAAHIFDAAGYAFSQGGYATEESLKSLIQDSTLSFSGEVVLSAH